VQKRVAYASKVIEGGGDAGGREPLGEETRHVGDDLLLLPASQGRAETLLVVVEAQEGQQGVGGVEHRHPRALVAADELVLEHLMRQGRPKHAPLARLPATVCTTSTTRSRWEVAFLAYCGSPPPTSATGQHPATSICRGDCF
jgi:hypothetical protein